MGTISEFFTRLAENLERELRGSIIRIELTFLRAFDVYQLAEAILRNGTDGLAVWGVNLVSDLFDIVASIPRQVSHAVQAAAVSTVAGLLLDDPEDNTVVLTRKTALNGVKSLLTTETDAVKVYGATNQWRFVQLARNLAGGAEKWLRVPGWASFVEKVIVLGVDMWMAVWDTAITLTSCVLLLHLRNREVVLNLFPALGQTKARRPAQRKVWTRERGNQK